MIPDTIEGWKAMAGCTVSTYRVGFLSDIHHCRGLWRARKLPLRTRESAAQMIRWRIRSAVDYLVRGVRERNWSRIRSYFNGWLCELDNDGVTAWATRAGHGWTPARAERDLVEHLTRRQTPTRHPAGRGERRG